MTNLYIEPDLIAPRDWNAHYREIKQRLLARCAEGVRKPKPAPVVDEPPKPDPIPVLTMEQHAMIQQYRDADTPIQRIARQICAEYGITVAELRGLSRKKVLTAIRVQFVAAVREKTTLSSTQIGAYLGGRDHTSVLYLLSKSRPRNYGGSTHAQQD